jgi:hypothetical protein
MRKLFYKTSYNSTPVQCTHGRHLIKDINIINMAMLIVQTNLVTMETSWKLASIYVWVCISCICVCIGACASPFVAVVFVLLHVQLVYNNRSKLLHSMKLRYCRPITGNQWNFVIGTSSMSSNMSSLSKSVEIHCYTVWNTDAVGWVLANNEISCMARLACPPTRLACPNQ